MAAARGREWENKVHDKVLFVLTKSGSLLFTGLAGVFASSSLAQANLASSQDACLADRAAISALSSKLGQMTLWDDPALARARTSLIELRRTRTTLIRLTRRLNGAEQSVANAEAFDKKGEAGFWRRDAAEVRAAIATENKKAKALAAAAGVSCPGCAYSLLIAKVEAAINAAASARMQAAQVQQEIARYRADMTAAGCRE